MQGAFPMMDTVSHHTLVRLNGLDQPRQANLVIRGPANSTFAVSRWSGGRRVIREVTTDANGRAYVQGEPY
jgi:hypothetical protein